MVQLPNNSAVFIPRHCSSALNSSIYDFLFNVFFFRITQYTSYNISSIACESVLLDIKGRMKQSEIDLLR